MIIIWNLEGMDLSRSHSEIKQVSWALGGCNITEGHCLIFSNGGSGELSQWRLQRRGRGHCGKITLNYCVAWRGAFIQRSGLTFIVQFLSCELLGLHFIFVLTLADFKASKLRDNVWLYSSCLTCDISELPAW